MSLHDALVGSPFAPLIDTGPAWSKGDLLHTNAAKPIGADAAADLSFAEEGDVLVSFRNIDTLAVIDLGKGLVTWALRGPWIWQHDPDILENGTILLFDILGAFGPGGWSRLLEIDPATGGTNWSYRGTPEQPFESNVRGGQQRLPDGNTLVVESMGGRLFEVDREGQVVLEFLNPARATAPDDPNLRLTGAITFAERVPLDYVDFTFNRMTQTVSSQ